MSDEQAKISITLIACRNFNLSHKYFTKETLFFIFWCGPIFLSVLLGGDNK